MPSETDLIALVVTSLTPLAASVVIGLITLLRAIPAAIPTPTVIAPANTGAAVTVPNAVRATVAAVTPTE